MHSSQRCFFLSAAEIFVSAYTISGRLFCASLCLLMTAAGLPAEAKVLRERDLVEYFKQFSGGYKNRENILEVVSAC